MSDYFKTIRDPLIEQQTKTDEKQDNIIEKLKDIQERIVQAIEYDPTQAITFDGKPLPELEWDKENEDDEEEEKKPS